MSLGRLPQAAAVAMAVGTLAACQPNARSAREVVTVDPADLCSGVDATSGVWESTPWSVPDCGAGDSTASPTCCWLPYPGRTALEIPHSLGRVPRVIAAYLSFENDGSSASPASGDTLRVLEATADHVTVSNGTQQKFYLRLALQ